MINYTIKTTDCLQAIVNCMTKNKCRYWMTSTLPSAKLGAVIAKLNEKYNLQMSSTERQSALRIGQPVWSLVVHYNPNEVGYFQFWLFTTGHRPPMRKKIYDADAIDSANRKLVREQNLMNVITQNPNELIRFKEYVLGQYVVYEGLKTGINKQYISPSKFGVPIEQNSFNGQESELSFKSMYNTDDKVVITAKVNPDDEERFNNINRNFGFLYYRNLQKGQHVGMTQPQILAELRKTYGVTPDANTPYNDLIRQLFKLYHRTNNRYLSIFQNKSEKTIKFTWYLHQDYLDRLDLEMRAKIRDIPTRQHLFEDSMKRIFAKGNFHGVRHQIGSINGQVRKAVKFRYPNIYDKIQWPTTLHYVRFSPTPYKNLHHYAEECSKASIIIKELLFRKEVDAYNNRKVRKALRAKDEILRNASVSALNKLIRENIPKEHSDIIVTQEMLNDFILKHPDMDPMYFPKSL